MNRWTPGWVLIAVILFLADVGIVTAWEWNHQEEWRRLQNTARFLDIERSHADLKADVDLLWMRAQLKEGEIRPCRTPERPLP